MPWVPWIESIFQSDVHKGEAASTTTTRASTLALVDGDYKFLLVEVELPGQAQMLRFLSTPI